MVPVTLPFIPFVIIWAFALVGYITVSIYIASNLEYWFNKLHTYVIKKGWL